MLPISETGSKVTTLNSWDFRKRKPSLTRNKWSQISVSRGFTVKTAKCRQNVHVRCARDGYQLPHASIPRAAPLVHRSSLMLQLDLARAGPYRRASEEY